MYKVIRCTDKKLVGKIYGYTNTGALINKLTEDYSGFTTITIKGDTIQLRGSNLTMILQSV